MSGQSMFMATQPERAVFLLGMSKQNVAPVQVAMFELQMMLGNGQRNGDLTRQNIYKSTGYIINMYADLYKILKSSS